MSENDLKVVTNVVANEGLGGVPPGLPSLKKTYLFMCIKELLPNVNDLIDLNDLLKTLPPCEKERIIDKINFFLEKQKTKKV